MEECIRFDELSCENCVGFRAGAYVFDGVRRGAFGLLGRSSDVECCDSPVNDLSIADADPLPPRGLEVYDDHEP